MMKESKFIISLWRVNLASALEYRIAFITQSIGMILNDGVYFLVWIIFFNRFKDIHGWQLPDMFIVFGVSAAAFGLAGILFGNAFNLGEIIVNGRLDYYLSLPRPTLLHVIASRTVPSGMGDVIYGFFSYIVSGQFNLAGFGRFIVATILAMIVFISFLIMVQSLSFWLGTGGTLTGIAINAMVTFAIYPITLFNNAAKLILFIIVPAAFMGAVPASFIRSFTWSSIGLLLLATIGFSSLAVLIFNRGLKRYESGSAFQIEV